MKIRGFLLRQRPHRPGTANLSHMNGLTISRRGNSQEAHAFDPPLIHEILPPAPDDDEEESTQKSEPAEVEEEKQKNEVAKATFRTTRG